MDKTIVGSTLRAVNRAKVHGFLEIKNLAILTVINKLRNTDALELRDDYIMNLDRISREIIYANNLCSYRQPHSNAVVNNNGVSNFINGVMSSNELYEIWLNQGNEGSITEFLALLLKDDNDPPIIFDQLPELF